MEEPLPLTPGSDSSGTPWKAIGLGVLVVLGLLAAGYFLRPCAPSPPPVGTGPAPQHPYAAQLRLTEPKMSTAQNFVGATVTYLEGKVTNSGDKTVSGATIESIFRNSLGELVQKEAQPLMYIHARKPYTDTSDLRSNPLKPGETREFRLTFDHVSADWNRELPELRVTTVSFQ